MAEVEYKLGIYVDISKDMVPRLNFTLGEHTTRADLHNEGAAELGASLLMSTFLCSMGRDIPEGTQVTPGHLPVAGFKGYVDEATNLPAITLSLLGGGELTFVLSPDMAAEGAAVLVQQSLNAKHAQEQSAKAAQDASQDASRKLQ